MQVAPPSRNTCEKERFPGILGLLTCRRQSRFALDDFFTWCPHLVPQPQLLLSFPTRPIEDLLVKWGEKRLHCDVTATNQGFRPMMVTSLLMECPDMIQPVLHQHHLPLTMTRHGAILPTILDRHAYLPELAVCDTHGSGGLSGVQTNSEYAGRYRGGSDEIVMGGAVDRCRTRGVNS